MKQVIFSVGILLGAVAAIAANSGAIDRARHDTSWIRAAERQAVEVAGDGAISAGARVYLSGGIPAACGNIILADGSVRRYIYVGPEIDVTIEGENGGFNAAWSIFCRERIRD